MAKALARRRLTAIRNGAEENLSTFPSFSIAPMAKLTQDLSLNVFLGQVL
jgi:hypothetical protein